MLINFLRRLVAVLDEPDKNKRRHAEIMATQAEVAATLRTVTAQIAKIGTETSATLAKVLELEEVIKNGGNASEEVLAALEALKVQAQATDDLVPDAAPPA